MQDKEVLIGATGTPHVFDVYPLDAPPECGAAVFCVAKARESRANAPRFILHIGQTRALPASLAGHPRILEFRSFGATDVGVLPVEDERERLMIVADLLTALSPPCNARIADPEFVVTRPT